MKSHGILFKEEMISAYLAGRKNQTRRLRGLGEVNRDPDLWEFKGIKDLGYMAKPRYQGRYGAYFHSEKIEPKTISVCPVVAPYGRPGDELWFKETFQIVQPWGSVGDEWVGDDIMEVDGPLGSVKPEQVGYWWNIVYKAQDDICSWWRPSIFMPKWASRITVPITNVRVERLRDITELDAMNEGLWNGYTATGPEDYHRQKYFELWDEINGKTIPASKNPWVWVYEFPFYEKASKP